MKLLAIIVSACLFMGGGFGMASANLTASMEVPGTQSTALGTSGEHLKKAESLEEELTQLNDKLEKLTDKIRRYENKPYLDTKGLRRDSLERLMGTTVARANALREQIAWHRQEASRLTAMDKVVPPSRDKGGRSTVFSHYADMAPGNS